MLYEYWARWFLHQKYRSIKMWRQCTAFVCTLSSHLARQEFPFLVFASTIIRAILFMFMNFKRQKSNAIWRNLFVSCYLILERVNEDQKNRTHTHTHTLHIFEIGFYSTEIDILLLAEHKKCIGHAKLNA